MYITDAGKSYYDYVQNDGDTREPADIINATRNLAAKYQKPARVGVGHYDIQGNNIMCRDRDGKLCLSMIDFGFGFAIEEGIQRNVLHFLFSGVKVKFDNVNTKHTIRECDTVHYNMFVMCFGMLRRSLESDSGSLQKANLGHGARHPS